MCCKSASNGAGKMIFEPIASRYDLANHLLSFGADFYWRKTAARMAGCAEGGRVLDIGCGTGDMVFAMVSTRRKLDIVGVDVSEQMLEIAKVKQKRLAGEGVLYDSKIAWQKSDSTGTGLERCSLDLVTCTFGLRNMADKLGETLRHMYELLRVGGRICILEFSLPRFFLLRGIYQGYLCVVLPLLGAVITGRITPYRYLARSIKSWAEEVDLERELAEAGFVDIKIQTLTFGIVTIHTASKQG